MAGLNIIAAGTTTLITGDPGSGKTFFCMGLAKAIHTGGLFLEKFPVNKARVAIINEESADPVIKERFVELDFPDDIPVYHFQGINLEEHLEQLKAQLQAVDLLVIDSLPQVHHLDENKAPEMKKVMAWLRQLSNTGKAIVAIHQNRKPGVFEKPSARPRGSWQIIYDVDMAFSLEQKDGLFVVQNIKSRLTKPPEPFIFEIKETATEEAKSVELIYKAVYDPKADKKQQAGLMIPTVLQNNPKGMVREEIQEALKQAGLIISDSSLKHLLPELEDKRTVCSMPEGRKKRYFHPNHVTSPEGDDNAKAEE